jgi:radical SAM protein with 4Fe4S-binding SPASM domain
MKNTGLTYRIITGNFGKIKKAKNIIGLKLGQRHRGIKPDYFPYSIDLEPTTRCNLKCSMCQVSSWGRECDDLSFDRFKYIVENIPTLVKIKLQGMGEPFLNKDFFKMVRYARRKGIEIHTSTNGTLMRGDVIDEIISSNLASLQVSLDGLNDEIRKGAHKQEIAGNIERLVAKRGTRRFPIISVWSVAMRKNIKELSGIIELSNKLRVDYVTLQYYLSYWGKAEWQKALSAEQIDGRDKSVLNILDESRLLAKRLNVKFYIYYGNRFARDNPCIWPWQSFYITADGFVMPCCILTDPRSFNFGNIFEKSLGQIWNGSAYIDFRERIKSGNPPDFCKGCYLKSDG